MDGVFQNGVFVDYLDPLKSAFRDKKYIVREFSYNPTDKGGVDAIVDNAEKELDRLRNQCLRWCKAHFGEVGIHFTL